MRFLSNKPPDPQPNDLGAYWNRASSLLLAGLQTTNNGLQQAEAENRLKQYGMNALEAQRKNSAFILLLSQFKSPLVLILIFASIVSAFVGEWTDAVIILVVVIGSTMRDAAALEGVSATE